MSRDLAHLEDMRLNAERALEFISGRTFEQFASDVLVNYAVARCLTIIGEAAGRVSDAGRRDLPHLDWSGMIGLRHVVVHGYDRVDEREIWNILHRDVPALLAELTAFLARHP